MTTITDTAGRDSLNGYSDFLAVVLGGLDHRMDGRASESTLLGLEGNDRLFGGTGNDSIEGGDGCDTTSGDGRDVIDLASIDADTTLGGEQNFRLHRLEAVLQLSVADLREHLMRMYPQATQAQVG